MGNRRHAISLYVRVFVCICCLWMVGYQMTKKKNPTNLQPSGEITKQQRKFNPARKAGEYALPREENAAGPIAFRSSKINEFPKMEPVRPGATDHELINRRGYFC